MEQPDALNPGGLAAAVIDGAEGITLTTLGLDYRNGDTCTSRSPRFSVRTEPDGDMYQFRCTSGMHSPVLADPVNWTRVRFDNSDAVPVEGAGPWPGFGSAVVRSLLVAFGSRTEAGPDFSGLVHLDNLAVNTVLIGKPGNNS